MLWLDHGDLLGLQNGLFFGCPIPEAYAAAGEKVQRAVDQAVQESEENGIARQGKEATPWLLNRVYELTKGSSLENSMFIMFLAEFRWTFDRYSIDWEY